MYQKFLKTLLPGFIIMLIIPFIVGCDVIGDDKKEDSQNITKVAAPIFNPVTGTFSQDTNVTLSSSTTDAIIYYTTDGSEPSKSSLKYSTPIAVSGNWTVLTIKAIATKDSLENSEIVSATFTINYSQVSTPQFSNPTTNLTADTDISITCPTSGVTIYYTVDGSTPTTASTEFTTTPIHLTGHGTTKTIKAIATKSGMITSEIASITYTINYPDTLSLDKELLTIDSNSTSTITATAKKGDGTDDTITAQSSDTSVATVSSSGLVVTVTGIKAGTSTITITSGSGIVKTCAVTLNSSWHTVFFDDFNRADSLNNNLGSNWIVNGTLMKILNNELYAAKPDASVSDEPQAFYNTDIAIQNCRITVKVKSDNVKSYIHIIMRGKSNNSVQIDSNYIAGIQWDGEETLKIIKIVNGSTSTVISDTSSYQYLLNTTYILELTYNNSNVSFVAKDINGNIIKSISSNDSSFSLSSSSGIGGGDRDGGTPMPAYNDDFKIEVFK